MYRLLIVGADKNGCETTRTLVDWPAYGFSSVMTAHSYVEALRKALDLCPHVALIDVRLDGRWGFELAGHLRSVGLKTAVCMLSDSKDPEHILQSLRSGAREYLMKPLDPMELQRFLEQVVVNDLYGVLPEGKALKRGVDPVLEMEYSRFSKITNKLILFVKSNYPFPQTLFSIAESFHMSSKYIGRIFLKDTGIRFSEYLMAYRMLEAKKLILNTQEKISTIANMVGYAQLNNFYIHFKNYFEVSPSTLRNFESSQEPAGIRTPKEGAHETAF